MLLVQHTACAFHKQPFLLLQKNSVCYASSVICMIICHIYTHILLVEQLSALSFVLRSRTRRMRCWRARCSGGQWQPPHATSAPRARTWSSRSRCLPRARAPAKRCWVGAGITVILAVAVLIRTFSHSFCLHCAPRRPEDVGCAPVLINNQLAGVFCKPSPCL